MNKQFHYNSDLTGGSLMVRDNRIVAELLLNEVTSAQWNDAIERENVLQKPTPASARRTATTIRKRLEKLPSEFWLLLQNADDELATQIAFCGALQRNLLLVEFIETVVRDAYIIRSESLDTFLWGDFLDERTHRDPKILKWKASSRKKTGNVVYRMLAEMGYLTSTRKKELQHVIIRSETNAILSKYEKPRIKSCLAVSARTPAMSRG